MRLDIYLVRRGLVPSRQKAQSLIGEGRVKVNQKTARKPADSVDDSCIIEIADGIDFVGRGGHKLLAAINAFGIDLAGKSAVDFGSSTGGFCDCMLQNGIGKICAVDVGVGQMDPGISSNPSVRLCEGVNARDFTLEMLGEQVDFLTADLSFISLTLLFPVFAPLLKSDGRAVVLVKPQFEAGRENIGKKGVITDRRIHANVLQRVTRAAVSAGFGILGLMKSPIKGGDGNTEFLMYMSKQPCEFDPSCIDKTVSEEE